MSTQHDQEGIAPAAGGIEDDGVRELHPVIMWGKDDDLDLYDFRARPEELPVEEPEEVDVPKASSAAGSALAAIYETLKTPDVNYQPSEEMPASVDTEHSQDKTSENGSSTGSETPSKSSGSSEPAA